MTALKDKSIKDAIHGYIKVEEPFWRIIDTAEFQRLKWVEQTSYRVLYPSARHDRFIHSIGVYHLGQKAIEGFISNSNGEDATEIEKHKYSFLFACLLHDIGHAPFSHTCEDLYNYQYKVSNIDAPINQELLKELKTNLENDVYDVFEEDYKYILSPKGKSPSEHEIMSAIVTCRKFKEYLAFFSECKNPTLDLDLIVRAILGCCYESKREDTRQVNTIKGIKNCLIRLLNSSTVDVDKLDYIARDTQMSGYDNIVLDTERLLNSVCMVCDDNIYYPSFKKSALSVINNVVLAKNSQAKWIVNHPIVIYESYILRRAIGETLKAHHILVDGNDFSGDELIKFIFSSSSLSKEGNVYEGGFFNLLSDVEILSLMKQNLVIPSVSEFFSRNERKSPIWKSHEEFLFCLESNTGKASELAAFIAPLISYLNNIEDLSHAKQIDMSLYDEIMSDNELEGKEEIIKILDVLKNYRLEDGSDGGFNYVILPAKNRFFAKIDSNSLYIRFNDDLKGFATYNTFENNQIDNTNRNYEFFYIYSKTKLNAKHFLNYLYLEAHKCAGVRM